MLSFLSPTIIHPRPHAFALVSRRYSFTKSKSLNPIKSNLRTLPSPLDLFSDLFHILTLRVILSLLKSTFNFILRPFFHPKTSYTDTLQSLTSYPSHSLPFILHLIPSPLDHPSYLHPRPSHTITLIPLESPPYIT